MTQIIFNATTGGAIAAGAGFTTASVQILPGWAPPIQYIGTTFPWMAYLLGCSTTPFIQSHIKSAHVRSYGRRSTLYAGAEVVSLSKAVASCPQKQGTSGRAILVVLTYRGLGEQVRP